MPPTESGCIIGVRIALCGDNANLADKPCDEELCRTMESIGRNLLAKGAMVVPGARIARAGEAGVEAAAVGASKGRLLIDEGGNFTSSERDAAQYLYELGDDVHLRLPQGTRAGGATSDLLVNGERWEVYTPKTKNPDRIVSQAASKGAQVLGGGVVIDLRQTSVRAPDLRDISSRIAGTGGRVSKVIILR